MDCQIGSDLYTPISQRHEIGDAEGYACICKDPHGDYRYCKSGKTDRLTESDMMDLRYMLDDVLRAAPRYRDMK